jgi:hypothetical protein
MMRKNFLLWGFTLFLFINCNRIYAQLHLGMLHKGGVIVYLNSDSSTGLVMQKNDIPKDSMDWWKATSACDNLRDSGYADWRLPKVEEWDRIFYNVSEVEDFEIDWSSNYWTKTEEEIIRGWDGNEWGSKDNVAIYQHKEAQEVWYLHKSRIETTHHLKAGTAFVSKESLNNAKRISVRCLREF